MHSVATPSRSVATGIDTDTARLFDRWSSGADQGARDALVSRYLPLARSLARRYGRSSEPLEDLVQVASLGLLKAIDRYDPARGFAFPSFAVPTILGEMRRHFRDAGWAVHVPRGAQERALRVRDAQAELTVEDGRAPGVKQLAEYLELETEEVLDALHAIRSYETVSLDAPRPGSDVDAVPYCESIGAEDHGYELVELGATLASIMDEVPERERRILQLRFMQDMTQSEIAAHIGVSQMQVSRLLRRSLEQLRSLASAADSEH